MSQFVRAGVREPLPHLPNQPQLTGKRADPPQLNGDLRIMSAHSLGRKLGIPELRLDEQAQLIGHRAGSTRQLLLHVGQRREGLREIGSRHMTLELLVNGGELRGATHEVHNGNSLEHRLCRPGQEHIVLRGESIGRACQVGGHLDVS
jgi:hypothetical protein